VTPMPSRNANVTAHETLNSKVCELAQALA
jgi:hypothetical protein